MKNFLIGLIAGLGVFLMTAAAVNHPKKAVGITNFDNIVYVLYDDGSVYANSRNGINGIAKWNSNSWVQWSAGVAENSVAPDEAGR